MKRLLLLISILTLLLTYFVQEQRYRNLVVAAKNGAPSHIVIEKNIGRIEVYILERESGNRISVFVRKGALKNRKILLRLPKDDHVEIGASFSCDVDLNERQFTSAKTEGFDYDKYLYSRGFDGVYKASRITAVDHTGGYRFLLREKISRQISERNLDGLLNTLILGDKDEFEHYHRMKELGISHLLVISGLHFSVIHLVVSKISSVFGSRRLRYVLVLTVMGFLLMIVKESYSAQRAFFTILYSETARLRYRRTDTLTTASFSLLMILILQPRAVLSTGLYLSYYTYLSVAFVYRKLSKTSTVFVFELFKFSLFIQFATLPISAYLFGQVNLYSFVANSLCVPLMSFMVPIAFLTVILSFVPFVGVFWTWMEEVFQSIVLASPHRTVFITMSFFEWMIVALFVLSLGYIFRFFRRRRVVALYLIAFLICFFPFRSPDLRIINFDVLHGDATLFTWKGRHFLIDTGDGKCRIAGELRKQGINALDAVIVTHAHQDHVGGLEELLKSMHVDAVYLTEESFVKVFRGKSVYPKERLSNLTDSLRQHEKKAMPSWGSKSFFSRIEDTHCIRLEREDFSHFYIVRRSVSVVMEDGLHVEIYRLFDKRDENDNGICIVFEDEKNAYYFFGDASENRIHKILDNRDTKSDLRKHTFFVKAPHHGSSTSSNLRLYERLEPDYVSVSHSHKYRLPSDIFMESCHSYYSTFYLGTHSITEEGLYHAYLE